ncbi:MAG: DUF262 domain-containing protein [Spirochaetaceae bacterium]|jgi:hypothetical protein|nr:DUF262 domain-containing protein [Spirochaetaceae bacterium]
MNIELHRISVRELEDGYTTSDEEGVTAYGGKLDIRPKYQREFVYNEKQRDAVIDTVRKGFPLNVMYWVKNGEDAFEVLDGQQRTISICEYVSGKFGINAIAWDNLTGDQKEQILNYTLMVYFCEGNDSEKFEWFKTVNIAGAVLTEQELRNATYPGPWLQDAKKYFSKTGCPAYQIGNKYLTGAPIRQDYLETALDWISRADTEKYHGEIRSYMSQHQRESDAIPLRNYFQSVITWTAGKFPHYRNEMKGIDWGGLYNQFKDAALDSSLLEKEIARLMQDDDVTNKKGIYRYVLDGDEKHLNIRAFTAGMKREAYERQKGICFLCNKHFEISEMEGDHVMPWSEGGHTVPENLQMLCKECNRRKGKK